MERLRPYLDHGILELDNNAAERGMRVIAQGRKTHPRRLRGRRQGRRLRLHPGRNGQAQRRRSLSLACRNPHPLPGRQDQQPAAMAMEQVAVRPDGDIGSADLTECIRSGPPTRASGLAESSRQAT
nr:IS66 family transposase [Paracoccus bogoriensis]